MLRAKIYFRQWRKFMPSRILKVLGNWHYNLLSDKTIGAVGIEIDKKNQQAIIEERNGNNEDLLNKWSDDGFYVSESRLLSFFE